jgi:hypothetical protein
MAATTVTGKGPVTVPKPVRDRPVSRFEALRGRAGTGLTTDQIMALTRGEG